MAAVGSGPVARAVKRVSDRTVAAVVIVVLSPILLLVALAIKLDSRGPVFFRQDRVGRQGKIFRVVKFRSMVQGAQHRGLGMRVEAGDPRITRVGSLLRRTSLDEIPQLINIACGEMSLVGPRPTFPEQVARYNDRQRRRLEVRPGLTGWAQVNGRNALSWNERIEHDIWYVDHWSLPLDVSIILRTPKAIFDSEGVYGKDGVTRELEDD
jgi:lipopolysaccharide/colanic/teichoic acid biosynthesis glycosyltransferase